ncbi:MAG: TetR/AcrR family transcriptional regulator [Phaeodactylibacter sp.]|nr:TetR/AcrR family transcriptional regulator [Phaeodactylibacter sp.]MCB9300039.1 TetR/AcrR family transcriptional regulator [Lewinellaceae bacterium]HQU58450.1 TetR/AcrR family transcriptional regulator [Saprospiraceae bacterium]
MNTRDRIIAKAIELFNTHGIHQIGVRDIAREMGISPGNLSYHFPKKEDLINEILTRLSIENDQCYQEFFSNEASQSLLTYLTLMRKIYQNQYAYRCIYLSMVEINQNMPAIGFNYPAVAQRRRASLERIFGMMVKAGEFREDTSKEAIEALVSFLAIINRFWISEAMMRFHPFHLDEAILHYLKLVSYQLSILATPKGREGIGLFFENMA